MSHIEVMKRAIAIFFLLFAVALARAEQQKLPADAAKALHGATNMVLYSLEPLWRKPPTAKDKQFQGRKVLGQTTLSAKNAQRAVAIIETGVDQEHSGLPAGCFFPRHGIRAVYKGESYDFVLCYECKRLQICRDDKVISDLDLKGTPDTLNKMLKAAKIPLAKTR